MDDTKQELMQTCINLMQISSNPSPQPATESMRKTLARFVAQKVMSFDKYRRLMAEKKC